MDEANVGAGLAIGRIEEKFDDVRRIAVLRGGGLGDLLFTFPAVRSLADAYPDAELVLLGSPLGAAFVHGHRGPFDRARSLPVAKGVHEPAGAPDEPDARAAFFAEARAEGFDLAVQLHGGGRWSNPFALELGARHTVGGRTPDAVPLERTLPYTYYQHEVLRDLEIVGLAGARPTALAPLVEATPTDLDLADAALAGLATPPLVIHPAASDPRRRWPVEHFAAVAERVVAAGHPVVVLGTPNEAQLAAGLVDSVRDRQPRRKDAVRSLAGGLDLSGLVGVLARSRLLLGNDSGPRHLAQALGRPTVSVYLTSNVVNAGPFGRGEHKVHIAWTVACPVCGVNCVDPAGRGCEHDTSFVADVAVARVLDDVLSAMSDS